ncbi:MAG TPA: SURF1 family protein [Rugosibacter sp.]
MQYLQMHHLKKSIPTLAALLVIIVTSRLGFWQLDRAHQRDALEERMLEVKNLPPIVLGATLLNAKRFVAYPAKVQGEWVKEKMLFLDNQIYQGQVGFQVLMPLRIMGSDLSVLVNRGWIHGLSDRSQLPKILTPAGVQTVEGIIHERTPRVGSVGKDAKNGVIWSQVEPNAYSAWANLHIQPLILYQTNTAQDGLVRDWPHPGSGADRNRGYAVQWFSLAAMTLIFWGYYFIRRNLGAKPPTSKNV